MNNKKLYIFLYYLSLILSIFVCIMSCTLPNNMINSNSSFEIYMNLSSISLWLIFINIIITIIFTIFLIKKQLNKVNILFPIIYILFTIIVAVICILFNDKLVIPYIHYTYYIQFILINYTLLNFYSLLSINKRDL